MHGAREIQDRRLQDRRLPIQAPLEEPDGSRGGAPAAWRASTARALAALVTLALVTGPATALADSKYTAARKCGRGAAGMVLGVLEIPGNMVKETRENGPARGLTLGFAMGLGMLVVRTLVGTYELLTSPFELPAGFKPIIEPEFPWDYFEEGGSGGHSSSGDIYESY